MWPAIRAFLSSNWLKVAQWVSVIAGVLGVLLAARKAGKDSERAKQADHALEAVHESEEIRREVRDNHRIGRVPKRVQKFYVAD